MKSKSTTSVSSIAPASSTVKLRPLSKYKTKSVAAAAATTTLPSASRVIPALASPATPSKKHEATQLSHVSTFADSAHGYHASLQQSTIDDIERRFQSDAFDDSGIPIDEDPDHEPFYVELRAARWITLNFGFVSGMHERYLGSTWWLLFPICWILGLFIIFALGIYGWRPVDLAYNCYPDSAPIIQKIAATCEQRVGHVGSTSTVTIIIYCVGAFCVLIPIVLTLWRCLSLRRRVEHELRLWAYHEGLDRENAMWLEKTLLQPARLNGHAHLISTHAYESMIYTGGGFTGLHCFYVGQTWQGIAHIVSTLLGAGCVAALWVIPGLSQIGSTCLLGGALIFLILPSVYAFFVDTLQSVSRVRRAVDLYRIKRSLSDAQTELLLQVLTANRYHALDHKLIEALEEHTTPAIHNTETIVTSTHDLHGTPVPDHLKRSEKDEP